MGPRYSSDGAVQAVVRAGAKKIAFDQSNVPGTGYIAAGPTAVAKSLNVPITQFKDNVPIQDANSIALKLVQAAGTDGGVVLNFTPPEALKILQAAQQQGLQDRVKAWGCSTPCNTDFVAKALGQQWDGKLLVNAELNVTDSDGPQSQPLPRGVREVRQQGVRRPGLVQPDGLHRWASSSSRPCEAIKGDSYTIKTVNEAIKNIKGFKTDILCRPWYYGEAPLHIPNNVDWTTTPKNGKMVIKEECFNDLGRGPGDRQGAQDREGRPVADGAERVPRGLRRWCVRQVAQEGEGVQGSECRAWRTSSHSWSPAWLWAACMRCPGSGWWSSTEQPVC